LRLLLVLLGTTTFFEGYDAAIPAVVLPDLAKDFGSSRGKLGWAIFAVGLGAFGALFITALGDRIGRRPLLIGTTLSYAVFTGLTATAHSVVPFVTFQFFAKAFLISELATALTMVAEEFPAERRGRAIGILSALGALGVVAVAVGYRFLSKTGLGWRGLYLIGVLPLVLVGIMRVKIRETHRFLVARQMGARRSVPFRRILAGDWRPELVKMGAVFFLSHFALLAALTWWTTYAKQERGFTTDDISTFLTTSYLLGLTGYLVAGRLQDRVGRRATGSGFMLAGLGFGVLLFQVHGRPAMFAFMVLAVFFGLGVAPVLNALAPELFPTEIRATAVAFIRSVFGTLGGILG
ncbi:MAG: MFS transporter, partial [Anaerolineales bacterium]